MTLNGTLEPELYRGMDKAALDRAYDNSAAFADVPLWRSRWQQRTANLLLPSDSVLDLHYGGDVRQVIDVFPVGRPGAPTALFFHGGFWTRNGKETFRFLLSALHRIGLNAAFAGYRLAPVHDMDVIVADATAATGWLQAKLGALGLAEGPLILIGWSAGAHLIAIQMGHPGIAGGLAISGIYDLEPMRLAGLNEILRLDAGSAERNSPQFLPPAASAPLTIAYGVDELPEFQRQSTACYEAWAAAGLPVRLLPVPGRHHHSVLDELYEPDGRLAAELSRLVKECR
jgi:arylformamidase